MRHVVGVTAAVAAALVGTALHVCATAAHADHPNTICSFWGPEGIGSHHVQVDWLAGRSFRVTVADLAFGAEPNATGDAYVPLPLEPNLRLAANTVAVGAGLTVSDVVLSQGVALSGPPGASGTRIDSYLKLPAAPWETASASGEAVSWAQDVDARSDAAGTLTRPGDTLTTAARVAEAAGVLDFTVTIPDDVSGEVSLVRDITAAVTRGVLSVDTETWSAADTVTTVVPGCRVSVEAVRGGDSTGGQQSAEQPPGSPGGDRGSGNGGTGAGDGSDRTGSGRNGDRTAERSGANASDGTTRQDGDAAGRGEGSAGADRPGSAGARPGGSSTDGDGAGNAAETTPGGNAAGDNAAGEHGDAAPEAGGAPPAGTIAVGGAHLAVGWVIAGGAATLLGAALVATGLWLRLSRST